MNSNINGINNSIISLEDIFQAINSSLGDAYQAINSLILSQRKEYNEVINSMNKKMDILNIQINQLKEENEQLKNTIIEQQNKLISLSKTLKKLSQDNNISYKKQNRKGTNLKHNILFNNKTKLNKAQYERPLTSNNISQNLKNMEFSSNKEIANENRQNIDLDEIQNSINQLLFNKKLKVTKEKTFSKSFNLLNNRKTPMKVLPKNSTPYLKENESQSSNSFEQNLNKEQSNTISNIKHRRRVLNSFAFLNKDDDLNQKDKFNKIEKKIKFLKDGLNINNMENNNDNYFRYNTYSLKRRNYSNISFEN